jgi:hypothetical protein
MLVAKREAPTTGHKIFRPPKKKEELSRPARVRQAM